MLLIVGILAAMMAVGVDRSYGTTPSECTGYTNTIGECTWFIEKWADFPTFQTLILSIGQQFEVNYIVDVIGTGSDCPAVDVYDTYLGSIGSVAAAETPKRFRYTRWIGPFYTCGDYTVENTAFLSSEVSISAPAIECTVPPPFNLCYSWSINVNVPCMTGCTLTFGYWKTHSQQGPAPYDDAWALLGALEENTVFYRSGLSYYEVLWKAPKGGNAYYILAHQFIAATLNILNGASSTPEVDAALSWANGFFNSHVPSDTLSDSDRKKALQLANLLDRYNNGYVGPGHCSE